MESIANILKFSKKIKESGGYIVKLCEFVYI